MLFSTLLLVGCGATVEEDTTVDTTPEVDVEVEIEEDDTDMDEDMDYSGEYSLDTDASTFVWAGSKVVGGGHVGTIDPESGYVTIEENELVEGEVVMDMTTILSTDEAGGDRLDTHLKSDDFFKVEEYPTSTLRVRSATENADGTYTFDATLEILGIANDLELIGSLDLGDASITMTTSFVIQRETYGIGSGFKGAVLEEDLDFEVTVVFVK